VPLFDLDVVSLVVASGNSEGLGTLAAPPAPLCFPADSQSTTPLRTSVSATAPAPGCVTSIDSAQPTGTPRTLRRVWGSGADWPAVPGE
jgi:hypothetical protein